MALGIGKSTIKNVMLFGLSCVQLLCSANQSYYEQYENSPLSCGSFDLQIQAGIAPIIWRNRGPFQAVVCELQLPTGPVVNAFELPKFHTFYRTPWIVGGQIGYALDANTRIYVEANYAQSRSKRDVTFDVAIIPGETVVLNLEKYKTIDAYFGARYYFNRWCDRASLFLGGKIGFVHHKKINFDFVANVPNVGTLSLAAPIQFYTSNTVVSGGFNTGLDYIVCGNISLVVTLDIVANCGFGHNYSLAVLTGSDVSEPIVVENPLLIGGIHSEIRFPITAGIRYSF